MDELRTATASESILTVFSPEAKQAAIDLFKELVPKAKSHFLGGSSGMGLLAADIDIFALVEDIFETAERMEEAGWIAPGFHHYGNNKGFIPLRKGEVNVILMDDAEDYELTKRAFIVCKYLVHEGIHPTKEQRKVIHRILRDEPVTFDNEAASI